MTSLISTERVEVPKHTREVVTRTFRINPGLCSRHDKPARACVQGWSRTRPTEGAWCQRSDPRLDVDAGRDSLLDGRHLASTACSVELRFLWCQH